MSLRAARQRRSNDIWPGFVDALATLLMVIIFLLMIFFLAQFFLTEALSGRDRAVKRLESRLAEMADLLSLERKASADMRIEVTQLSDQLQSSLRQREDLQASVNAALARAEAAEGLSEDMKAQLQATFEQIDADKETIRLQLDRLAALQALEQDLRDRLSKAGTELAGQKEISLEAQAEAARLNQALAALRNQLAALQEALDAADAKNTDQEVQITALGKRLNAALATKVQELSRYRSEFFGRLREVLGNQKGIQVVGDRFVFQSEVLFASGSAELGEPGQAQLAQLATTLKEISAKIPEELNWILRVDGHTDVVPIRNEKFSSNWELSAARAISVVNFLIEQGIAPDRLAATGFGEFQPLNPGKGPTAYAQNRRIELKLTNR